MGLALKELLVLWGTAADGEDMGDLWQATFLHRASQKLLLIAFLKTQVSSQILRIL